MAHPITMPSFGMYTAEGTLVSWLLPSGSQVEKGQPVLEIETEKATQETVAPASGRLHHVAEVGTRLKEQELIGYVLEAGELPPAANQTGESKLVSKSETTRQRPREGDGPLPQDSHRVFATPAARRLASQNGIDLSRLSGTGPGGRIVEADVQSAVTLRAGKQDAQMPFSGLPFKVAERIPLNPMRRAVGERLRRSLNSAISLTLNREAEARALVAARRRLSEAAGISIPFDAFFVRFVAEALSEFPEMNAVIEGDTVLRLQDTDIGIAVDVQGGLIVPVIRQPARLPLTEVAKSIRRLAERARSGKIAAADLEGASSTVTNLGHFGVDAFTPVLNPPQSTILGIGQIRSRAVVRDQSLLATETCVLNLTFDHRVADGVPAAKLLDSIASKMRDEAYLARLE